MNKKNLSHWLIGFFCISLFQIPLLGAHLTEIVTIGSVYPSSKIVIGSQVPGRVQEIWVDVSEEVKQGQPLLKLDSTFFEIEVALKQAALDSARLHLIDSEKDFLRMQRLWGKAEGQAPSISLKKFEEASSKYQQSLIAVRQNEENLKKAKVDLDETLIRAPFDGIITQRLIDKGELVSSMPSKELFKIQSIDPVYLEFSIPQSILARVQVGSPLLFEIEGTAEKIYTSKIDLLYPQLDEATRSLRCRSIIENKNKNILPGSLAKITIKGNAL
jgi:membrane fusion protein, multidrug efflux system